MDGYHQRCRDPDLTRRVIRQDLGVIPPPRRPVAVLSPSTWHAGRSVAERRGRSPTLPAIDVRSGFVSLTAVGG